MHVVGAVFFFLLAGISGSFGVYRLFTTMDRTIFGTPEVSPALPALQFGIAILFIVLAIVSARACATCTRKHRAQKEANS